MWFKNATIRNKIVKKKKTRIKKDVILLYAFFYLKVIIKEIIQMQF